MRDWLQDDVREVRPAPGGVRDTAISCPFGLAGSSRDPIIFGPRCTYVKKELPFWRKGV